jgi:hypothetical protein
VNPIRRAGGRLRKAIMFRRFMVLAIAACALATPAAAQTPTPATTAFDGKYVGTATSTGGGRGPDICGTVTSVDMTITGGQVVIHEVMFNGRGSIYRGSVNAAGEISAFQYQEPYSTYVMFFGAIREKVFAGQRVIGHVCYYSVQMQMALAPAMPFDGDYVGVSRESSCLANGVPVTLSIRNNVVTGGSWQGIVNPQGVVVMGNRLAPRVDGQIDRQGMIRAQGSSSDGGCTVTFVWRKQS